MNYKVEYQYMEPGAARPFDEVINEQQYSIKDGAFIPLPAPGDSIELHDGRSGSYKVLTRHFMLMGKWIAVNIVVTDIDKDELAARIRQ